MPRRRQHLGQPRDHVDGPWATGRVRPGAPLPAHYALAISRRLRAAIGERSQTSVAVDADLARSTIHDLLTGRSWPDVVSLAKLEHVLGTTLWPDEPVDLSGEVST